MVHIDSAGSVELARNIRQGMARTSAYAVGIVPVHIPLDKAIQDSCGVHASHSATLYNHRNFFHGSIVSQEGIVVEVEGSHDGGEKKL